MSDMLSNHFSMNEGTDSNTASENGIDNTPSDEILANMKVAAAQLDVVRDYLKFPIHVNSWYRSPELNAAVGGVGHSAHMDGWAIDFICPQFGDPESVVKFIISSGVKFDQCIQEGTWTHISFAPAMRQQVLTAHFDGEHPATYTQGA